MATTVYVTASLRSGADLLACSQLTSGNWGYSAMQDPKSPYVPVLSPTLSSLFSDVELAKPVKLSLEPSRSKISPATCPPKWNDVAREIQVETSKFSFSSQVVRVCRAIPGVNGV